MLASIPISSLSISFELVVEDHKTCQFQIMKIVVICQFNTTFLRVRQRAVVLEICILYCFLGKGEGSTCTRNRF